MDQISVPPTRDSAGLSVSSLDRLAPYVLGILRIMAALLFIEHGLAKFFGFPVRTMEAPACSIWNGSPRRSNSAAVCCWRSACSRALRR